MTHFWSTFILGIGGTLLAVLGLYALTRILTLAYYKSKSDVEFEAKRRSIKSH